ncbi:uncharacterized protein THITE_33145 [Thermothielavioides terrestris NRRL 8126]|uniref:Uncharacterized protein n=1 Tax=Thermothielavioides terrestris (strain ATCC 38088 / NRRL 8126) TaxID=578455 RepID=G2R3P4_THETT|nr:uncharacterized protein THITE_33145 [Thermothielavioides terrestris NRRL 8126]AEO65144.1 hypothetical protein THITE_33145 [Thermothielavioides terrestris NRRL 8126]
MLRLANPSVRSVYGAHAQLMPGVRCPTCASNGVEVWVLEGRRCAKCGTACL